MNTLLNGYSVNLFVAIRMHLFYVITSVTIASILGIVLGIILSKYHRLAKYVLPIIGIFQTVPGIVFIAFLMIIVGMNQQTVIIALSIYAIFPIIRNTYTGLMQVDPLYMEIGKACGMNTVQLLFRVQLPIAMNTIVSGIRMALVYTVSWAVLAAMIGQGGLGEFIYIGVETNIKEYIILGSIPAAVIAVLFRFLVDFLHKITSPRGLRGNIKP